MAEDLPALLFREEVVEGVHGSESDVTITRLKEGRDLPIAAVPPASLEVEKALPDLDKAGISAPHFDPKDVEALR